MGHKAISLFSGGGGIDCGLDAAGFNSVVCVDMDAACAASLAANVTGHVICAEIAGVTAKKLLAAAQARRGEIDLIAAGPPCQPFSKSANWRYGAPLGLSDPRAQSLDHMMSIIEGVLPQVVLIENVPGFAKKGAGSAIAFVEAELAKINERQRSSYRVSSFLVDAADYGVPQHRRRFIAVADRDGREFQAPEPTHGPRGVEPYVTAWDAIGDLRRADMGEDLRVRGRWAELLPSIPEGENYLWHTPRGGGVPLFGYRTRYWSFLLKLAKARPAWTLAANPSQNSGPFHWDDRLLSVREIARLQSFPDTWTLVGSRAQQVRQLGNAVPPLLGEVIAREIGRQLLGKRGRRSAPRLALPARGAPPSAREPADVPRSYLRLVGHHSPHPGHGLGPGARRRSREARASSG